MRKPRPLVVIESPFRGRFPEENVEFARRAMEDAYRRGERPFASHLLYTQILDDGDPEQRVEGIELGWDFFHTADLVAVYVNNTAEHEGGISDGMRRGIQRADEIGVPVEYRTVPGWEKDRARFRGDLEFIDQLMREIRPALRSGVKRVLRATGIGQAGDC